MALHLNCDTRCFTEPLFGASARRPGIQTADAACAPQFRNRSHPKKIPTSSPRSTRSIRSKPAATSPPATSISRRATSARLHAAIWKPANGILVRPKHSCGWAKPTRNCTNFTGAREAYEKFIALSSDAKEIEAVKKTNRRTAQEPHRQRNDRQDRGPHHVRFRKARCPTGAPLSGTACRRLRQHSAQGAQHLPLEGKHRRRERMVSAHQIPPRSVRRLARRDRKDSHL